MRSRSNHQDDPQRMIRFERLEANPRIYKGVIMSQTVEGPPVVEGAFEASDAHLHKEIGLFGLIALAVSVQVGSGWLLATLAAAAIAGPASIFTWVLGAVFFAVIGVT
jgi:hypothetical protein